MDPRLHSAWIESEMASPAKKPSYPTLARKQYGDGLKFREAVRKGIERLHRRFEKRAER